MSRKSPSKLSDAESEAYLRYLDQTLTRMRQLTPVEILMWSFERFRNAQLKEAVRQLHKRQYKNPLLI